MATIITVTSRKGGVGKTSLATSLASILAHEGFPTLLVDADPQSCAAQVLGVDPLAAGTAEWLIGKTSHLQEAQLHLHLLAASPLLEQFCEEDVGVLQQRLGQVDADFVVIDTAAGSGAIGRAATSLADIVLVASEPHPLGLAAANLIIDGLPPDKLCALVLSRLDPHKALHREIEAGAPAAFHEIKTFSVRTCSRLERALATGKPAAQLSNRSRGKVDVEHIADWILEKRED